MTIEDQIKTKIQQSPFCVRMLNNRHADCVIEVQPLDSAYCKANNEKIVVDSRLAKDPELLKSKFHFIVHELYHWMRGQKYHDTTSRTGSYFDDMDEVSAFAMAMAYAIYNGEKDMVGTFLPLIRPLARSKQQAIKVYHDGLEQASKILKHFNL